MKEILDEEELLAKSTGTQTTNMPIRAVIYVSIMLVVGYFLQQWMYWSGAPFSTKLILSIQILVSCIFISVILELFRFLIRRIRQTRSGIKKISDPFWFQGIEGGFGIWILFLMVYFGYLLIS